jgi:hypothetical protein
MLIGGRNEVGNRSPAARLTRSQSSPSPYGQSPMHGVIFTPTRVAKMPYLPAIDGLRSIAVPPNRRRRGPVDTIFNHVKRMRPDLHG